MQCALGEYGIFLWTNNPTHCQVKWIAATARRSFCCSVCLCQKFTTLSIPLWPFICFRQLLSLAKDNRRCCSIPMVHRNAKKGLFCCVVCDDSVVVRISYRRIYINNLYMDWVRWEVINLMRYFMIRISFISRFIHIFNSNLILFVWYDTRKLSYLSPRYLRFGTWCSDTSYPPYEVSNPGAIVQLHCFGQITYPKWLTDGNIALRGETKRQFQ